MAGLQTVKIAKMLKEAGQWDNFTNRKLELTVGGLSKKLAYNQAVEEFTQYFTFEGSAKPTAPGEPAKLPAFVSLDKKDFDGKKQIADKEAVDWAIANVGFKGLKAKDAPSSTAWMYVVQFRASGDFLRDCLKKRVPTISKLDEDEGHKDDGRKSFELIAKLRAEQADKCQ